MSGTVAANRLLEEARTLIDAARQRDIVLRLLGGLAIALLCPESPAPTRAGQDLDFGSPSSSREALTELLAEHGYVPDRDFNEAYGNEQLHFAHPETGVAVEVLIDKLQMCHTLQFGDRLDRLPYTLEPIDLLLSKLQIVEPDEQDVDDCLRLLVTFPLAESDEPTAMDVRVFRSVLADDWGWWKTITLNLDRIRGILADGARPAIAGGPIDPVAQLDALTEAAEETPKTRRWTLRSRIGEHRRWYEEPEETPHD